jgi:hypothetical protein
MTPLGKMSAFPIRKRCGYRLTTQEATIRPHSAAASSFIRKIVPINGGMIKASAINVL